MTPTDGNPPHDESTAWASPPILARHPRYQSVEYAGRGSMGAVYRAFDQELGQTVAIKTILDVGPDWIYRLKREFRSLRGVVDRNLVQLYDLVVGDDSCFFSMEFVEGDDFVTHVRGGSDDPPRARLLERFEAAAPQLVSAVTALHAAGHLHRDIKPTNTKVDRDGRVVLLDFDLVAPVEHRLPMDYASAQFAGTLAYMAPEQMLAMRVSAAADWYGVGVMFYESLTGSLPIDGDSSDLASILRNHELVPILEREPGLPDWLVDLIEALLAKDPGDRPVSEEIQRCLAHRRAPDLGTAQVARDPDLTGRDSELAELERIRRDGGAAVVTVHGSSGIGKTELIRTFLARTSAGEGDTGPVVLAGRCSPQETVLYNALDPIVDALSRHLIESEASVPSFEPARAAALVKLFPVLARVKRVAEAAQGGGVPDAVEARRLGTGALRRLLGSVAYHDDLVIWIDDVQWGDVDSGNLLGEILRPPDAPPVLVVLSYRSEDRASMPMLAVLDAMRKQFREFPLRELELAPLGPQAALLLARRLSESRPLPAEMLEAIVAQANGSPFLIQEMVRHVQSHGAGKNIDLSNVVSERLAELAQEERLILELVSLCGQPAARSLVLRAAGLGGRGLPLVARLEGRSLVRVQVSDGDYNVQAYHDHIREAVSDELAEATRSQHHEKLARVFESSGRVEPDVLAHHFHGAGLLARAADHAVDAADKASDSLAFLRAAEFYRQAREWDPRSADWQRSLRTKQADCIGNASRLNEAGREYLAASVDAPQIEALDLRRRATEHLVSGGSVEEGIEVLEDLLRDLGLTYPRSAGRALIASLGHLARILIGPPRRASDANGLDEVRIDTCHGIGKSLVGMDAARGAYFSILGLRSALEAGDGYRIARSLGVVGGLLALAGGPLSARGRSMMTRARRLSEEIGAPELLGPLDVAEGQVLMLSGNWHDAREKSDEGVRVLSEQCRGFAFERNVGRGNLLRALEEIGESVPEIANRAAQLYEAATSSANVYAETAAVQHLAFVALARDQLDAARELAERGVELWDREGFHVQHLYTARAVAQCDLYAGTPLASYERWLEIWAALRKSSILRISQARVDTHYLRGQLALAMASANEASREDMLSSCESDAHHLEREKRDDARSDALFLRAGIQLLRNRAAAAVPLLQRASDICDRARMPLRGACALLRRGEIIGGDAGGELAQQATRRMNELGVENPRRWAAMYALGFEFGERPPN